jgi:hypothetical protein
VGVGSVTAAIILQCETVDSARKPEIFPSTRIDRRKSNNKFVNQFIQAQNDVMTRQVDSDRASR